MVVRYRHRSVGLLFAVLSICLSSYITVNADEGSASSPSSIAGTTGFKQTTSTTATSPQSPPQADRFFDSIDLSKPTLKAHAVGFNSNHSKYVLHSLLDAPDLLAEASFPTQLSTVSVYNAAAFTAEFEGKESENREKDIKNGIYLAVTCGSMPPGIKYDPKYTEQKWAQDRSHPSDVSFVYLDNRAVMRGDNYIISHFQEAINALIGDAKPTTTAKSDASAAKNSSSTEKESTRPTTTTPEAMKKTVVILYAGPNTMLERTLGLVSTSWDLFDATGMPSDFDLSEFLQFQCVAVPASLKLKAGETLSREAVKAVDGVIKTAIHRRLSGSSTSTSSTSTVESPHRQFRDCFPYLLGVTPTTVVGMEHTQRGESIKTSSESQRKSTELGEIGVCLEGSEIAMRWAREQANASIVRLNRQPAVPTNPGFVSSREEFSVFVENLRLGAQLRLTEYLQEFHARVHLPDTTSNTTVSDSSSAAAAVEMSAYLNSPSVQVTRKHLDQKIYSMMLPFFKRQVILAREKVADDFTAAVGEEALQSGDFELSGRLVEDLEKAKRAALRSFSHAILELTPKSLRKMQINRCNDLFALSSLSENLGLSGGSSNTAQITSVNRSPGTVLADNVVGVRGYSADFEKIQFKMNLDAYIAERKVGGQLQGYLPRGRQPIDFSMHVFLPHPAPLGRDYRQDALGLRRGTDDCPDKLVWDPAYASPSGGLKKPALKIPTSKTAAGSSSYVNHQKSLVRPELARGLLSNVVRNMDSSAALSKKVTSGVRQMLRSDSEFAREMLMFPLSIKNPDVPMSGSGGRGKRSGGPPQKDVQRLTMGPERYIVWDSEEVPALGECKRNLDRAIKRSSLLNSAARRQQQQQQLRTEGGAGSVLEKIATLVPNEASVNKALASVPLPVLQTGYYKHPPIDYGPAYRATVRSPRSTSSSS